MPYADPERAKAWTREYTEAHREEARLRSARHYLLNRDKIREKQALPENRAKKAAYYAVWNLANKTKLMVSAAKKRAEYKGWDFDLKAEDLVVPEVCPILGIPMYFAAGPKRHESPSLDRLDSSKGYTKDNVWIISWRANQIKTDATLEELATVGEWARNVLNTV